ncbi:MAG TPA: hypothetical protein VLY46_14620 [Usitatibacter sp.]|nr:hypothetical protein [Usitatibacter sp.]
MSRRVLVVIAILIVVVAFGMVVSLKRAIKANAAATDPDSGAPHPATAHR